MDQGLLHERTQKVILEGQSSSWATVASGVPQGSVLGPLLFLIYINDLLDCVTSSTVRLFADDAVLYHGISSPADTADLQRDLDALQACLLYTSPSPRDRTRSRMPSSA